MASITLNALAHTYTENPTKPEDYAIREMTHVWEQGGAFALLGPSGCGKSTLLNIISGLLKPSNGEVLFDGKRVNELKPEERNIAQVFQFPVVYDTMTVFDNLAFPLRNIGVPEYKVKSKVYEVAEILELSDQLKRKAKGLSADQKQKVSMGRGLVRDDVSAILFDEPLTVIDPQLKWKLRRKLKQIHEQFNITMVYVTHDQLEASTFADKIAVMYNGQIVQFGTPRELFENPAHTFVGYFIGSPGMNFFDAELKNQGGKEALMFGDHEISVSDAMLTRLKAMGANKVTLGIRPEFVHVWDGKNSDAFHVDVDYVEDLGTYKILSFLFHGQVMKARLSEDQKVPSGQIYVSFPEQWTKVYVDDYLVDLTDSAVDHDKKKEIQHAN
ncbi:MULTISPECIES: ABC transporter ATP-binding protein [Marinomonas]|uniref:ABC transporter ATP-binding protein n=1 Tax=Marinomonas arctica TaxID=383750 RepID=A0A7H1J7E3_9GAMM|nr:MULTISPECIES: ABC transporter ATP-binding protein [Marinomonas]MCS7485792.1 ABC transporter ATP-binding protein [Marinomonas sp. BSi20414]QNT06409.1 ABC transporter ATP-binding protein [Marinomonas arctica]GGN28089.1 ABC transporter ATP-binding protein [Marinomonas arctica]